MRGSWPSDSHQPQATSRMRAGATTPPLASASAGPLLWCGVRVCVYALPISFTDDDDDDDDDDVSGDRNNP